MEGRCKREEKFGWCLFGKKCFYGHLLQNDTDYSRQKRGSEMEVKIDKDIKEEDMYIIMSTTEISHLGLTIIYVTMSE